ncbi:ribonuclease H-like domain-containing protein [Tanacetum coccineum]
MPATPSPRSVNMILHDIWYRSVILSDSSLNEPKLRVFPLNAIQGKLVQFMHTTMVPEQVKTMKIHAGVHVSRPRELRRHLQLYDIVLTASSETLLQKIISSLHHEFSLTNLSSLNYFLGISVTHDSTGMFLSQRKYDVEILDRTGMDGCNSSRTPIDTKSKLGINVQQVCLHMHDPWEPHFSALKRILCYARGTLDHGLQLFSSSTTDLVAYSDADWAGCPTNRRAEAEYCGVANAVAETCWLRNLLRELHTPLTSATLVYCDNVSAIYLSSNPVQHQRTNHIEIDIHFVHDLVAAGQVRVLHVPSCYQFADIFTKGLPSTLFEDFRTSLNVRCSPAHTAVEC